MPVFWLEEDELNFPHPEFANEDGILAVGGDLSPERLLLAYQNGIFPWFNPEDPIIWWSPNPRFVLFPEELRVSKSMRPYFNQQKFTLTVNKSFEQVIYNCSEQERRGQGGGTWITDDMMTAYCHLNELGYAHSVEVWQGEDLVGGLYGVALGKIFFGESMFMKVSNASKFGFIALVRKLKELGYWIIDCQQNTRHLASLGGRSISRLDFLEYIERNKQQETDNTHWKTIFDQ